MIPIGRIGPRVKDGREARVLSGLKKGLAMYGPAIAVLALDQGTKQLVRTRMALGETLRVSDHFNLHHVVNKGGAFSILHGNVSLLAAISAVVVLVLIVYERRKPTLAIGQALALGILLGGTVGNLMDRVVFGQVTDVLDVYVGTFHWPTFNVADIAINLGVGSLLLWQALHPPETPQVPSREEHHR